MNFHPASRRGHIGAKGAMYGRVDQRYGSSIWYSGHAAKMDKEIEKAAVRHPPTRTRRGPSRDQVLKPLLEDGLLEMTVPEKPRSSKQRYQTTEKGRAVIQVLKTSGGHP